MSQVLTQIFRDKLSLRNNQGELLTPDQVEHYCECCGVKFICYRRDITYVMVTFLMALRDMEESTGEEYHEFRKVIEFANQAWKTTPSDYSLLAHWKLIKSIKGKTKMKALTQAGREFIANKKAVSSFGYCIPHSETILWSKTKVYYLDLYKQYLKDKEDNEPFLEIK